eukprot:1377575-Lingulodinium_polyedra.AAC.1
MRGLIPRQGGVGGPQSQSQARRPGQTIRPRHGLPELRHAVPLTRAPSSPPQVLQAELHGGPHATPQAYPHLAG